MICHFVMEAPLEKGLGIQFGKNPFSRDSGNCEGLHSLLSDPRMLYGT